MFRTHGTLNPNVLPTMPTLTAPTIDDIREARMTAGKHILRTPLRRYPILSELLDADVWVKHENFQLLGSFKVRGGINLVSQTSHTDRARGFVTASSGNHGQSIAYASRAFDAPCTIVLPEDANPVKAGSITAMGAKLVFHGDVVERSRERAEELAKNEGMRFVCVANEPALIAGVGAGFYAASKFTGLFLVVAIGATIFLHSRGFKPTLIFLIASLLVGGQWYIWNFIHTGDPVFPFLYSISEWLGIANLNYWNTAHSMDLESAIELRRQNAGISHLWLTYPVAVTFFPPPEVQAGRVGLGPIFFFLLPTAIYGIWKSRTRLTKSRLLPIAIVVILFYTLLMTFGSLPKVRHLLPFVPAILLCLVVTSISCSLPSVRNVLAGGFAIALILNLFAHFMFSRPYLIYHFQGKDREQFLSDNLLAYAGVKEVNRHSDITRLYIWDRHLSYYINPPTFFAAPFDQILIDSRIGHVVPVKFFNQLKEIGFYPERKAA